MRDRDIARKPCRIEKDRALDRGYVPVKVNGRSRYAHQMAWEEQHGSVKPGNVLVNVCGNRACSEPTHWMEVRKQILAWKAGEALRQKYSGQRHPNAKFSNDSAKWIRAHLKRVRARCVYRDGEYVREMRDLADRFGVSVSTISRIANRKVYTFGKEPGGDEGDE